jgi:hypothetical protein
MAAESDLQPGRIHGERTVYDNPWVRLTVVDVEPPGTKRDTGARTHRGIDRARRERRAVRGLRVADQRVPAGGAVAGTPVRQPARAITAPAGLILLVAGYFNDVLPWLQMSE